MIGRIVRNNLLYRPLNTVLSVLLLTLGVGIISLILVLQTSFSQKMDRDLKDIDMVVGAKGSPLQIVLSAVYHMDAPTGNIPLKEVNLLKKNRMIAQSIPLAYGDSYKGYRILGTTHEYLEKYEAQLRDGKLNEANFEAVIGATIAERTGLKTGDEFVGTHGNNEDAHTHDEFPYKVTGVLKETGTVLDQLVLTNVATVWDVHPSEVQEEAKDSSSDADQYITALLIQLRSPMALMTLPRKINESTSLQAAVPTLEINRLMGLLGIGTTALHGIAWGIILVSSFSIFIALYNRMRERRYEMALMRLMGCSRIQLSLLVLAEAWLIALLGYILGFALSRIGVVLLQNTVSEAQTWPISLLPSTNEGWLIPGILIIGTLSALLPAIQAYRLNIAKTLSND